MGLTVYIVITVFFITYTFNTAFLAYNKKLDHLKHLILEIHYNQKEEVELSKTSDKKIEE
jgi:hypothetical protein